MRIELQKPAKLAEVLAATALFLIAGIGLMLGEIPHDWALERTMRMISSFRIWLWLLFPVIGYGIGWVFDFPRWSYPYIGSAIVMSLYMTMVATPGLRIFGFTFNRHEIWGWRAWIPFLVVSMIAIVISLSLHPIISFFEKIWLDWTLLAFTMYGLMPFLILVSYDEMDRLYSLQYMLLLTILMCLTVVFYMRGRNITQRALSLALGILVINLVIQASVNYYWSQQGMGSLNISLAITLVLLVTAVMLSPVLVGLIRFLWQKIQTKRV